MMSRVRAWAGRIVAGLALPVLAYAAAGLVGGAIPTNAGRVAPTAGITIYVETNGIHTGLVMPKFAGGVDWRGFARADHLADPRYARYDHVAIGWGGRDFYLRTATWADIRPATILHAAIGSDATLLHVEHVPRPRPTGDIRALMLRPAEYRRLTAFIMASAAPGGRRYRGYAGYDVFYTARGHYDAIRTCNAWTGDALRQAGVRIGIWTPFPVTVMGWF